MAAVWKGITALTEQADSPRYVLNGDAFRETRRFSGKYTEIMASVPPRGVRMTGSPFGYRVMEIMIDREPGDKGSMAVVSEAVAPEITPTPPPGDPTYEIEWVQHEKSLLELSYFEDSGTCPHDKLAWYFDGADKAERDAIKEEMAGNAKALLYIALREKGIEGYMAFYPVVRVISLGWKGVLEGKCGTYRSAAAFDIPVPTTDGATDLPFVYVKTAMRCTKTGKKGRWERHEEWTGFVDLPEDDGGNILFYKSESA